MHRNDLFLLLACATVVAAMASNPPHLSRAQVDLASLLSNNDNPSLALAAKPDTLEP